MEKRLQNLEGFSKRRCVKNEKGIYTANYDNTLNHRLSPNSHGISDVRTINKTPFIQSSSKETVELSLEVEIANSLKQLITSPEKHDNSPLLDVTIIRPSDIDCIRGSETSSAAFTCSEVKNLIATMERQKQHKRRLIELYKKELESTMMNPIMEIQEATPNTGSKHMLFQKNEQILPIKRKLKRSDNVRHGDGHIGVMSEPTKPTLNYRIDTKHAGVKEGRVDMNVKQPYAASIAILKPLVGEIRNSLKHLEAKIVEGGDQHSKGIKTKLYKTQYTTSNSSTPEYSEESVKRQQAKQSVYEPNRQDHHKTHQIYATPTTFEKLRHLLACQNTERNENRDQEKEKPCLCQHCGMIGLLVDSQKGPVVPTFPLKKSDLSYPKNEKRTERDDVDDEFHCIHRKDLSKSRQKIGIQAKTYDNNYKVMHELSSRLEALENRVIAQEQNAVPKEYFKRVINKILNRQVSHHALPTLKTKWTQYSRHSLHDLTSANCCKDEIKMKNKSIQIQSDSKRKYFVNPLIVETNFSHPPQSNELRTTVTDTNKNIENKTAFGTSEFFTIFDSDRNAVIEENKKYLGNGIFKGKTDPIESFWRWGEEIIKPGIDLKTKILSLLQDQFQSTKEVSPKESKNTSCAVPEQNKTITKTNNCGNNDVVEVNLIDVPKPFEDKENQVFPEQTTNVKKFGLSNSSSKALKKVLDLMSEKIYNDHVKPTVEAIKKEQKHLNMENTEQIYNIKAAMNAAFYQMNTKETQVSRKNHNGEDHPVSNETKCRKKILEPSPNKMDERSNLPLQVSHLIRKSAIPVRVANTCLTESTTSGRSKYKEINRSLIPRLKSPPKDSCYSGKLAVDSKFFKDEAVNYINKVRKDERLEHKRRKHEEQTLMTPTQNIRNTKNVKVTYMNPNARIWNEESTVSVPVEPSEEITKAVFTDNSSTSSNKCEHFCNNIEEKRRIPQNRSISDKLAILTEIASTEVEKSQLWKKIWNQAKHHCKSKQDTVIIQVPTKLNRMGVGITEVEFTIEDIQKLISDPKLIRSIDNLPQQTNNSGNMESFLLIRSRKILEDVHKRLGSKFLRSP